MPPWSQYFLHIMSPKICGQFISNINYILWFVGCDGEGQTLFSSAWRAPSHLQSPPAQSEHQYCDGRVFIVPSPPSPSSTYRLQLLKLFNFQSTIQFISNCVCSNAMV